MTFVRSKVKIAKGTRFRSHYADSNPLWEVKKVRGVGVWECEIVPEDRIIAGRLFVGDYVGTKDVFTSEKILDSIEWSEKLQLIHNESDRWYQSLVVGQIVHYHNAFSQYVRCVVVNDECNGQSPSLKPLALVGAWQKFDLPKRRRDGTIAQSIQVDQIQNGTVMRPNASNIYECYLFSDAGRKDPRKLKPLDLSVPDMTPQEILIARLWTACAEVKQVFSDQSEVNPVVLLERAKDKIEAALRQCK